MLFWKSISRPGSERSERLWLYRFDFDGILSISFDDKPSPDKSRTLSVVPTSCVLAIFMFMWLILYSVENIWTGFPKR